MSQEDNQLNDEEALLEQLIDEIGSPASPTPSQQLDDLEDELNASLEDNEKEKEEEEESSSLNQSSQVDTSNTFDELADSPDYQQEEITTDNDINDDDDTSEEFDQLADQLAQQEQEKKKKESSSSSSSSSSLTKMKRPKATLRPAAIKTVPTTPLRTRKSTPKQRLENVKPTPRKRLDLGHVNIKKPHRFRPGTVALREIRREQKSTDLKFTKIGFSRLVREIAQDIRINGEQPRFQAEAIQALQVAAEEHLREIFENTQTLALFAKTITIAPNHMTMAVEQWKKTTSSPNFK